MIKSKKSQHRSPRLPLYINIKERTFPGLGRQPKAWSLPPLREESRWPLEYLGAVVTVMVNEMAIINSKFNSGIDIMHAAHIPHRMKGLSIPLCAFLLKLSAN